MSTTASLKSASTSPLPLSEEEKQKLKWEPITQIVSSGRYGCAATSIGNQFLLFGGYNNYNGEYMSNSDVLDVDTQTWSTLPSMPTARYYCTAVVVDNCAIVIGSYNGSYLATVEMIDLKTKKWTTLPSMSSPRDGCVAVVVGNHVIVMGGLNGSYLKTVEMYDIDSRKWTNLPPMSTARSHFGAAVVDEKVYVFGGEGAETVSEVYNTRTQEWTMLPSLPFSHMCGAAVAIGKQIVLMGGYYDGAISEKVNMFDTESHEWTSLPPMTTKRSYFAASLVQNQLIVAAGQDEISSYLNTVERMVVPMIWLSLPTPPEIPPAPSVLGRLQRKSALQQWVETTIAIKKEYLDKVEEKRQIITEAVKAKKEELDKQFREFEEAIKAKKEELNEQFCDFEGRGGKLLKELEDVKDGWVELVDDQIEDAKDQLGHLMSRLNPPPLPKSDKPTHIHGRTVTKNGKDPPSYLLCPITGRLMNDPVLAADGQTYERVAIEHHISQVPEGQDVYSPITGGVLESRKVFPNGTVRNLVHSYRN